MISPRRIVHVDVNAFYCSCERLFRPDLATRPIVVLSNNDGCVVARDAAAKKLGIPMGQPWFQMQELVQRHGIVAFSSNYTLYGDMSRRVMNVLAQFSPDQEIYSIDECFLDLSPQPRLDGIRTGQAIRRRVQQWTGLPVCVGIGASKTLAKLADWIAKHDPAQEGVCDLTAMAHEEVATRLANIEVRKVWGVGRRLAERLREDRIFTAGDLRGADPRRIRERYGVTLERTVRELQGRACIALEETTAAKQQIISSRSFGAPIYSRDELAEPIVQYMTRAAEKLRRQHGVAAAVGVWIETNRFRPQDAQYSPSLVLPLALPCDDTAVLVQAALKALRLIHRDGYRYVKAGVMLLDLRDRNLQQGELFDMPTPERAGLRAALMQTLDSANAKWGRATLGPGSAGLASARRWTMHREMLSPCYTTRWRDLAAVRA